MKGNFAGEEVRSKPRNQTSVSFKFGAMVKVAYLAEKYTLVRTRESNEISSWAEPISHSQAML